MKRIACLKEQVFPLAGRKVNRPTVLSSEFVVDADLDAGHAVFSEAFSAEKPGNGIVFKIGIGELAVQGRAFGQAVEIAGAVFFHVAGIVIDPV